MLPNEGTNLEIANYVYHTVADKFGYAIIEPMTTHEPGVCRCVIQVLTDSPNTGALPFIHSLTIALDSLDDDDPSFVVWFVKYTTATDAFVQPTTEELKESRITRHIDRITREMAAM